MRQHQETSYDRATAIIDAVNDAEIVIVGAIKEGLAERHPRTAEQRAHEITQALDNAGFEIRYRPLDIVPETSTSKVRIHVPDEASERKLQDLLTGKSVPTGRIVEVIYRKPDGTTETVRHAEFGQIDKVSYDPAPFIGGREIVGAGIVQARERVDLTPGRNVKEEAYALTPKAEAAIKAFVESVPLTQAAISAGTDALERQIEESFAEPLDAIPDPVEDLQAQAVRRVIKANRLLAQAVEVLGCEAVDLMMHNLAAPDLEAAA